MAYMVVDFNHVFCKLNTLKIKQALCKILIKTHSCVSSPFSKSNNSSTFIHSCINISLTHTHYLYNFSKLKTIFKIHAKIKMFLVMTMKMFVTIQYLAFFN